MENKNWQVYLYNFAIGIYNSGTFLASFYSQKAAKWRSGRKNLLNNLRTALENNQKPVIWFHCASLGEFEQGRPLIEKIKKHHPNHLIFLTFFSPSGYEVRKNYPHADHVFYLPPDTPSNARSFIDTLRPEMAFFVKYEFWYNYLSLLKKNEVPTYLICGIFRDSHIFFREYGGFFRKMLRSFTHLFVQDENSYELLHSIGIDNASIAPDTRFDRVVEIVSGGSGIPEIETFKGDSELIVYGSTWPADEDLIVEYINQTPDVKHIIAPHEIRDENINRLIRNIDIQACRFSTANNHDLISSRVLVIDNIGLLSSIYRYAKIAYVGGGFNAGIHNILEPAVYSLPVVFGPKHNKFNEATGLIRCKGGFSVGNKFELMNIFTQFIEDPSFYQRSAQSAGDFVRKNTGGTEMIYQEIQARLTSITEPKS